MPAVAPVVAVDAGHRPRRAGLGRAGPAPGPDAPAPVEGRPAGWSGSLETMDGGRRRRRWLPWLVGILVVAALVGLGFLAYTLFRTPTHEVPELVGLDEAAARAQTADFDWELEIEQDRSDEHPEIGEIIRTAPSAGERLGEGEPFLVVVSEGPELRTLPDLDGMTLTDAETALARLRLVALPATDQFDETVPVGSVISWSVPSDPTLGVGGEVLPDTEIALVVSTGTGAAHHPDARRAARGRRDRPVGRHPARRHGGRAGVQRHRPDRQRRHGDPRRRCPGPPGSTVALVPSKGVDLVVMPDLTGQTLDQARATLGSAGLTVGSLLGTTAGTFQSATVLGEPAAAGAQFKRGSAVDMVFL